MKFKVILENELYLGNIVLYIKIKKEAFAAIFGVDTLINLILGKEKKHYYIPRLNNENERFKLNLLTILIQKKVNKIVPPNSNSNWKICGYHYENSFEVLW